MNHDDLFLYEVEPPEGYRERAAAKGDKVAAVMAKSKHGKPWRPTVADYIVIASASNERAMRRIEPGSHGTPWDEREMK